MKHTIKIAKFSKIDNSFELIGYDEYQISYSFTNVPHILRVMVNGIPTNSFVDIHNSHNTGYKKILLRTISEFKNRTNWCSPSGKTVKMDFLKKIYNERIINIIEKHILPINKEVNRDTLTKFNLI